MALDEKARQAGYENFRDMVLKNREAAAKLLLEEQDNAILNAIEAGEPGWFGKTVDWFAGIWEGFQRGVHAADGWLKTAEEWWGNEMMNVTNPFQVKGANTFRQQTGPDTQILWSYNPNFPIDGSNAWLRTLSPFTIRLVPPMVYLANPDVLNKTETSTFDSIGNIVPIRLGVYDQTASSPDSFGASARKKAGASRGPSSTLGNISTSTNQKHSITSGGRPMSTAPHVSGTTPDTTVEPALTDLTVATQLSDQLDNILNAPPLHLLINPESFSISYSKIQQFQERSRFGYIFQAWGEQQPVISFSGRIGAYYSKGSGVQFATKRNSAAFQNLMALFNYYKNNGYLYDTISNSEAHLHVGLVAIDYDQFTYFGNFNSFGWGYEEAYHGGGISFEMEFNVVQMFDNTGPNDNLMVNPMDSPILDPMNIRNQGYDFTNATSRSASSPKLSPDMEQGGWGKKDAAPPKIYTAAITEPASVPYTGTPDGDIPTPTYSTERLSPNDKGFERVAESTETSAPESLESGYFIRGRRV
jgi:hypothetical protein